MRIPALALAAMLFAPPCHGQEDVTWHSDLGAARAIAATQKRPLLLLFRCER